jgi:Predicted hydrolases or acyltransferases (alpha/beta hydrolase superfamily)
VFRRSFESSYGTISYIERSGKIPVIFLHGLGGTGNSWMKLPQHLKEDIGLYFLDLVGQGRSAKPDIEYTISVQEDVIGELTEALGLEDVSLVGNSYGGWVAMRYSLDRKQPTHLVLEDSAGVNRTFGEMEEGSRDQFVEMVVRGNPMNARSVISNIVKNNSNPSWKLKESELKKLKAKTLIIWGKMTRSSQLKTEGCSMHIYREAPSSR